MPGTSSLPLENSKPDTEEFKSMVMREKALEGIRPDLARKTGGPGAQK